MSHKQRRRHHKLGKSLHLQGLASREQWHELRGVSAATMDPVQWDDKTVYTTPRTEANFDRALGTDGIYRNGKGLSPKLHNELVRQRAKPKREPLVADRFLAEPRLASVSRQFDLTTRDNLRLAHRFVLDDAATRYAAELTRSTPSIIADAQEFARPPFERTYIEFPFHTWWRTMTGNEPDSDGDYRLGYLIVGNTIRTLSYVRDKAVGLAPMEYELWNPYSLPEQLELVKKLQTSRFAFDVFYWGESVLKFVKGAMADDHRFDVDTHPLVWSKVHDHPKGWSGAHTIELPEGVEFHQTAEEDATTIFDETRLRTLRANHRVTFHAPYMLTPYMWRQLTQGSCGELRNILAMLIFINRTSKLRVEYEEPTIQRMWKTRPIPLLKHRVITLRVNPLPKLLKIAGDRASGMKKRRHDVRGHWCHNRAGRTGIHAETGTHDWVESREDHLQFRCTCGGLRWWKRPHVRGSADKGVITAQYQVKE